MKGSVEEIKNLLARRMENSLPGQLAQYIMAPSNRMKPSDPWIIPEGANSSAVLLLLFRENDSWKIPLMRRQIDESAHSGQISLPGGKAEERDRSLEATALREAEEEIGIDASQVSVVGKLTPVFIPVSNFFVQPVLGIYHGIPSFKPDPAEVAEILHPPVIHFLDPVNRSKRNITVINSLRMNVPCFELQGEIIWGATAMILSEFSEMIREEKNK